MEDLDYKKQEKHLLAVDCIIFGYENEQLKLLLFKREIEPAKNKWSLIGGWVKADETVEDAAKRILENISSLQNIYMEQVQTYSDPARDPGGRVISVAFYALINMTSENVMKVEGSNVKWISICSLPGLIFDHDQMVSDALDKLRAKASHEFIVKSLLPKKFTLLQLRELYNALFQKEFDPGNFRKKVLSMNVLERLREKNFGESKKGAHYYRFKEDEINGFSERIVKFEKQ
ncbi:MAG: NUDIX hydrolase [Bacteroidales bacterium]